MSIASLPMYDLPGVADATDAWWRALQWTMRQRGHYELPNERNIPGDLSAHWLSPQLAFSQSCGWPLTHQLTQRISVIATPCYRFVGCQGGHYSSALITRRGECRHLADFGGRRVAVNGCDSQSGYNALFHSLAGVNLAPTAVSMTISGSHANSLALIRKGDADLCAIDCVTWGLMQETRDAIGGLQCIAYSRNVPGLPYICAASHSASIADWRATLIDAVQDRRCRAARRTLGIVGIELVSIERYRDAVESMASAWQSELPNK
ncbi:PhnD/SsuA/transferrin family substrate-binding protein [Gammaproteobacteria bacterium]|nr:PhnD/SsuA/transferrin family substrate-binding protein [Gammaproteobacteria bacterium]